MFKITGIVLALAVFSVNGRPYDEEKVVFECNGKPNGYYADVSNVRTFFSCEQGNLIARVMCEDGFVYDGEESCIPVSADAGTEDKENVLQVSLEGEQEEEKEEDSLPEFILPKYDTDDDDADDENENGVDNGQVQGISKRKVFNIEITKNIFPKSIIFIGKANREQKNK